MTDNLVREYDAQTGTDVTMVPSSLVVCLAFLALASATTVEQCPGKTYENLSEKVQLTPCKRIPCKLKKGTEQHITIEITPESDMQDVKNSVTAEVLGVPLPFVGVDGKSVCDKIETEDGQKAPCPLKAGTKYVYKDSFPILAFYPSINVKVHWALLDSGDKDIICFEVPAQIK